MWTVLVGLLAVVFSYYCVIEPLFLSPLRHIPPAHPLCAISSAWISWIRFRRHENRSVCVAHRKQGPVIRLSPNELSINCVDAGIRTVYGGGFEKHSWYNSFRNFGHGNMFSSLDSKSHTTRKRALAHIYSKSFLFDSPALKTQIAKILNECLFPLLDSAAVDSRPLDVYEIFLATSMDFITAYLFGFSGFANFIRDAEKRRKWLSDYQSRHKFAYYLQEAPWMTTLALKFGVQLVPRKIQKHTEEMEAWVAEMCDAAGAKLDEMQPGGESFSRSADYPLVYSHLRDSLLKSSVCSKEQVNQEIYSEFCDQMIAGHETSGITLTYVAYELSRNPAIQEALRTELRRSISSTEKTTGGLSSARAIDALPLLNAIVLETFRLYPAIAGAQARRTPLLKNTKLGVHDNIPGGVRVAARASSLHMNPAVYPQPDTWQPERWLNATSPQLAEMNRWLWVFGSGGRMCIGSHFATHEVKSVAAFIYARFKTDLVRPSPDMTPSDAYSGNPAGGHLVLQFTDIKH